MKEIRVSLSRQCGDGEIFRLLGNVWAVCLINQSQPFCFMACFGGVIHLQFGYDILSVAVYRMFADFQFVCNHFTGFPILYHLQYDFFPSRKKLIFICQKNFFLARHRIYQISCFAVFGCQIVQAERITYSLLSVA